MNKSDMLHISLWKEKEENKLPKFLAKRNGWVEVKSFKYSDLNGTTRGFREVFTFPDHKKQIDKVKPELHLNSSPNYCFLKKINGAYYFPEYREIPEELGKELDRIDSEIKKLKDLKEELVKEKFDECPLMSAEPVIKLFRSKANPRQVDILAQILDEIGYKEEEM